MPPRTPRTPAPRRRGLNSHGRRHTSTTARFGMTWVGMTVPPRMLFNDNQIFSFTQAIPDTVFIQTYPAFNVGSGTVQFSYFPQFVSLQAIFDQYRIDEVEITFRPLVGSGGLLSSAPQLYTVVDYDDASTSGYTVQNLLDYSNCTQSVYETVVRKFKPHVAVAAYSVGTTTLVGYQNQESPWLDTASINVPHYGVKYGLDGASSSSNLQSVAISLRIRISFRNVR
jgi:hypothetical protein